MSMTPIYIQQTNHEPSFCPECGKPEKRKEVCAHCGHEYEASEFGPKDFLFACVLIAFAIYIVGTLLAWLALGECGRYGDRCTLLQVLQSQWEWIKGIRLW